MEEQEQVIQDDSQDQEQLPPDASDDDLTLEELDKVDDDDFQRYHNGEVTGTQLREKYGLQVEEEAEEEEETEENAEEDTQEETSEKVNYEDLWKEVSAPFKANGKMYQPQSPSDVVSLMQKGVNYTQKMQQIAPYRKVVESLRSNNIDENELNFLIDLHKGNQDAIKSLLKRNKVDAMSMDYDQEAPDTYRPHNNMASDEAVELSEIVSEIEPNREKIYDIVFNKWDKASQNEIIKHPELLKLLNEELELGRYETIQQQLDNDRMFGRNSGMTDLQAYSQLAAAYERYQQQQFQQKQQQQVQQQSEASSKRAAAPSGRTNVKAKGTTLSPNDILSMSEDDFNKIDLNKLLAKG